MLMGNMCRMLDKLIQITENQESISDLFLRISKRRMDSVLIASIQITQKGNFSMRILRNNDFKVRNKIIKEIRLIICRRRKIATTEKFSTER